MVDGLGEEGFAGGELVQRHIFIGLVRLADVPRPADQGRRARLLEQPGLRPEGDLVGLHVSGQGAGELDHVGGFVRRQPREASQPFERDVRLFGPHAHFRQQHLAREPLHVPKQDVRIEPRQGPVFEHKLAQGRHGVGGHPALDGSHLGGGEGRVEVGVERPLPPEPVGGPVDEIDQPRGVGDGVDAVGRQRGVGRAAHHPAAPASGALVACDHLHPRGLADDAAFRRHATRHQIVDHQRRAGAAQLLVER